MTLMGDINCGISSSSIVSFANDTGLYHGISNADDCSFLQNDLNSNIYVLVLILHHLLTYTPVLVLISVTTLKTFLTSV